MTQVQRRGAAAVCGVALTMLVGCGAPTSDSGPKASTGASSSASGESQGTSVTAETWDAAAPQTASAPSGGGVSAQAQAGGDGRGAGSGVGPSYPVVSVVDGDTIKVRIDGQKTTIRLIGVDTPETKKPHVGVQCFGKEASSHMQSLVQSRSVQLAADPTQTDRDKYGRLLRYVYVGPTNVGLSQIQGGFAREYTYDKPYQYQAQFRQAQADARAAQRGTWGGICHGFHTADGAAAATPASRAPAAQAPADGSGVAPGTCAIKGNINARDEKIAHAPGTRTYARTTINQPGERMFCSVAEATAAGWRMASD